MPWTEKDVDGFKKNLTPDQKTKWVAIANATLALCKANKGKNCEGMAIKVANSKMKEDANVLQDGNGNKIQSLPLTNKENDAMKPKGFLLSESFQFEIDEQSFEEKDGKKQLIVTLMQEGPGNLRDMNFYKRSALESLVTNILKRPKQFDGHSSEIDNAERSLKSWMSSVVEAWVVEENGTVKAKAKVQVYDDWLWERAKKAPKEMSLSVEGRGSGKIEEIEGKKYNAIYEITMLNGVHWVDYPGNAGMGVEVIESQAVNQPQEEEMDITKLVEELKNASPEDKTKLAEAMGLPLVPADNSKIEELAKQVAEIKASGDAKAKDLETKLGEAEAKNIESRNKIEAHEIKAREDAREKMVDSLLAESRLKAEHKTATFKSTLISVRETKIGDKMVTEEEQMKQLIKDRESICLSEKADPNAPGGDIVQMSEAEKQIEFNKKFFGRDTSEVYKHAEYVGEENVIAEKK